MHLCLSLVRADLEALDITIRYHFMSDYLVRTEQEKLSLLNPAISHTTDVHATVGAQGPKVWGSSAVSSTPLAFSAAKRGCRP